MKKIYYTMYRYMKAIAVFQNKLKGSYCTFYQDGQYVNINGHIKGLTPGKHGFHIHTYGDLRSTDCAKCGGHWNPKGKAHGGLHDENSHAGDLGNVTANEEGIAKFHFKTNKFQLFGNVHNSIIGRSIVVHKDEDDLGRGGYPDSCTTGHAGERVDCAVIGIGKQ